MLPASGSFGLAILPGWRKLPGWILQRGRGLDARSSLCRGCSLSYTDFLAELLVLFEVGATGSVSFDEAVASLRRPTYEGNRGTPASDNS